MKGDIETQCQITTSFLCVFMFYEVKSITLWCRSIFVLAVLTCCRTCHTMQVVSLEPEIRWMPQWSVDRQVTMSEGKENKTTDYYRTHTYSIKLNCVFIKRLNLHRLLPFSLETGCVLTHVSDVLSHCLALNQGGDPEAVVPVAAAEEQLAVVGDHKQSSSDFHTGGEGSGQETLSPT